MYLLLRKLLNKSRLSVKQFFTIYLAVLIGVALLYMGGTGILHPLFAFVGAALPLVIRLLARGMQAASLYQSFRHSGWGGGSAGGRMPESSEISSRYIHLVLTHKTGQMDGRVLTGSYKGTQLSEMTLDDLLALLSECQTDSDSYNLLMAYLDREHPGWQAHTDGMETGHGGAGAQAGASGDMNETQALDILGLPPDAGAEQIVKTHRQLMQKIHPDRGGSTYLAAKINAAKDLLMTLRNQGHG